MNNEPRQQDNKTPEEIAKDFASTCPMTPMNVEKQLTALLKDYQKQEFNRAIELAAKNAEVKSEFSPSRGKWYYFVEEESILNLKIK